MDSETARLAREILQNLLKAKKNLRMYPENNPIYIKTVDSAYLIFRDFFEYRDTLPFKIKQFEIIYDGDQVYYNTEKDENLALFFFKDGIRELCFKAGLQKKEIEDFLKIISEDFDREATEDDVVTLMWERDFENISYIVDETFLADEENEDIAIREVAEKSADEDQLLKAYEDAFGADDAGNLPVIPLTDEDIAKLKEEQDRDSSYYIYKLVDLLFEMLFLAEKKDDYQEMVSFFRSSIDFSLHYSDIENVVRIVAKAGEIMDSSSCPEVLKPYLKMVTSYLNSERVINLLGEMLDSRAEVDESRISKLFLAMDKSAIPGLIRILGELNTIHARKAIINCLIILGKKDLAAIAKGLNDNRWFVVRNIIYVLRNIGDKRAIEYLIRKIKHEDIRVRKEVIKALGDFGTPDIVQHLRGLIDDPDSSIRGLAAKSLAQSGSPVARKLLIDKLSSSEFRNRDFSEKKEFFEALSKWSDKDVVNFLIKTLKSGSFFRRSKINENRACAAYALGFIGKKEALGFLAKYRGIGNTLIREYVNAAIMRIEHGFSAERNN